MTRSMFLHVAVNSPINSMSSPALPTYQALSYELQSSPGKELIEEKMPQETEISAEPPRAVEEIEREPVEDLEPEPQSGPPTAMDQDAAASNDALKLPAELLLYIFKAFVPPRDVLLTCSRVCKEWHSISLDSSLWLAKVNLPLQRVKAVDANSPDAALRGIAFLAGTEPPEKPAESDEGTSRTFEYPDKLSTTEEVEQDDGTVALLSVYTPSDQDENAVEQYGDKCHPTVRPSLEAQPLPADPLHTFRSLSLLSSLSPILESELRLFGIKASSVDHPEQNIHRTLDGLRRSFWSSTGSPEELLSSPADSAEYLVYSFQAPCIVRKVEVTPFNAIFQRGSPVYPPISIRIGLLAESPEDLDWDSTATGKVPLKLSYLSPSHPIPPYSVPYSVELPPLFLPCHGIVVFAEGKRTAQPSDGLYYTVFQTVKAHGIDLQYLQVKRGWFGADPVEEEDLELPGSLPPNQPPALESSIAKAAYLNKVRAYLTRGDYHALSEYVLSHHPDHPLRGTTVLKMLVDKSAAIVKANAARNARIAAARARIASGISSGTTDVFDAPSPAAHHLRSLRRHIFQLSSEAVRTFQFGTAAHLSHPESVWLTAECVRLGSLDPLVTSLRRGFFPLSPEVGWILLRGGHIDLAASILGAVDCIDLVLICLIETGKFGNAMRFLRDLEGPVEGLASALGYLRGVLSDLDHMSRGERRGWALDWDGSGADRVPFGELEFLSLRENEWPMRPPRPRGAAWSLTYGILRAFPMSRAQTMAAMGVTEEVGNFVNHLNEREAAMFAQLAAEFMDNGLGEQVALQEARSEMERRRQAQQEDGEEGAGAVQQAAQFEVDADDEEDEEGDEWEDAEEPMENDDDDEDDEEEESSDEEQRMETPDDDLADEDSDLD